MEQQDFVKLYAPHNAKNLTQEQLAAMAGFTKEQVKMLADAYPNGPKAYLILKDKNKAENKQIYPRSTWKNLLALWHTGQKQFVATSYIGIFNVKAQALKMAPVQDMTKDQVQNELKTAAAQTAVPSKEKSAEQIAAEEKANLDTGSAGPAKEVKPEKPLKNMNKTELTAKFKEVFDGETPDPSFSNKVLIKAIESKQAE